MNEWIFDHKAKQFWLRVAHRGVKILYFKSNMRVYYVERQKIAPYCPFKSNHGETYKILNSSFTVCIWTRKYRQIETLFKNIFYLLVKELIDEKIFSKNLVTHFL